MQYTHKFIYSCICALSISGTIIAMSAEEKIKDLLSKCNAEVVQTLSAHQAADEKWPEIFEKIGVIKYLSSTESINSDTLYAVNSGITNLKTVYKNHLNKQKKQIAADLILATLNGNDSNLSLDDLTLEDIKDQLQQTIYAQCPREATR